MNPSLRSDFRVVVPADLIREVAVWFSPEPQSPRLAVAVLGPPRLRYSMLGPTRMAVTDLSIRGLGLRLTLPERMLLRVSGVKHMFVYMQLWDPSADDPHGLLTIFTSCLVKRAVIEHESLLLGAVFSQFAVGSHYEKALEFLDAKRCGVSELAAWCDKVSRGVTYRGDTDHPGLDIENLLAEVERAQSRPPASEPEENP
ncbi:hypothetical protein [Fundidesulfovibrio butyratiphilus]